MVITVARSSRDIHFGRSGARALMVSTTAAAALLLGACASDKKVAATAPTPAPTQQASASELQRGNVLRAPAGAGRFRAPTDTGAGTPDLNSVPTQAPVPKSSQSERDQALAGLVADRTNARYSDQGGRTMPVSVRPLIDTPESIKADAVARLEAAAPPRPAPVEPAFAPTTPPVVSDVGPRSAGARGREEGQVASAGGTVNLSGFRALAEFDASVYSKSSLAGTMTMIGGNLTPNDRNVLNVTARQQIDSRGKGMIRVVGHGTGGVERAVIAAGELQRLGVAKTNIFVGVDNVSGPTEVFLDRAK